MRVYVHSISLDLFSLTGSNRFWVGCTGSSPDLVLFWVRFWPGPFAAHRIQQDNDNNHKAESRANQRADGSFYSLKLMLNDVFKDIIKFGLNNMDSLTQPALCQHTILNILAENILWSHHTQDCGKTGGSSQSTDRLQSYWERDVCVINNGCRRPVEARSRVEVAKGLMERSPPSVTEVWRCCSLHTYFHTNFLLRHEHSKQTKQIPKSSVLLPQPQLSL